MYEIKRPKRLSQARVCHVTARDSFFFATRALKVRIQSSQWASSTQKNRLSRRTSCSIGTALVTPGDVLLSRRDVANALAAVQLRRLRHRRSHALRTSSRTFSGADSALACESAPKNSAVSPDHLPPTSAPRRRGVRVLVHPPTRG